MTHPPDAAPPDRRRPARRERPPLDAAALEAMGLRYVERYATTRAKLVQYLRRKLAERGWAGEGAADPAALAARLAGLGYVDDKGFADARGAALVRRGFGARRVTQALQAAGVGEDDRQDAERDAGTHAFAAAMALARRRRIGPFAAVVSDRAGQERAIAALVRAGHGFALARRIATASPGETLDPDEE